MNTSHLPSGDLPRCYRMMLRHWFSFALPLMGIVLALAFVIVQGDSYRATTELRVDARSSWLASIKLPNLRRTGLTETRDGVRIVGHGSTAEEAALESSELLEGEDGSSLASKESAKTMQDRLPLEELAQDIATLQIYAELLREPSEKGVLRSLPITDLTANASSLIDLLGMLIKKQTAMAVIESRLRDLIPPHAVKMAITNLPLDSRSATLRDLLAGFFATLTVLTLLAVRRNTPSGPEKTGSQARIRHQCHTTPNTLAPHLCNARIGFQAQWPTSTAF